MTRCLTAVAALAAFCWCATAAPVPKAKASDTRVIVETSLGDIEIELFPDKAPKSVQNFLGYVDDKFYDGLIVHRVVKGFCVQGGGYEPGMKEKKATRDPVVNEANNSLKNLRGTVAVARAAAPDSGTCQFFVNLTDSAFLDGADGADSKEKSGYCVFGKVVAGMDVVDAMAGVKTGQSGQFDNVPVEDVVIKSVRRKK